MRIGRVINGYSNYLAILAIDVGHAASYRGPGKDVETAGLADDFNRACHAIERKKWVHAVGEGTGILAEIGGCGAADVYRFGETFVIPESYRGDEDADADAEHDRVVAEHPTSNAKLLGSVEVPSGVLLLTGLLEPGPKLAVAKVAKAKVAKTPAGVAIAVPPGRYDVWRELFKTEVRGDWGSMPSRVRVVPAGTKVVAKQPIATLPPKPAARTATATTARRLFGAKHGWEAISSIVVAPDGRTFAGEDGRFGAAAWSADGTLLWQRQLVKSTKREYYYGVQVALVGTELLALPHYGTAILVLDPATGKQKRAIAVPKARAFAVTPDRERLVVRENGTTILSYPTGKVVATLTDHVNYDGIAITLDGKYLAVTGTEVYTYALTTLKRLATWKPPGDGHAIAFTHDAKLVVADGQGKLAIHDPRTGKRLAQLDPTADRARKPRLVALATTTKHVAVARDDGVVTLIELATKQIVARYEKHAKKLSAIAFTADGATLWVGAGIGDEPVGLTAYFVTEKRPEMPMPASTSKLNQRAKVAVSAKYK